jgi:hypothetical protein
VKRKETGAALRNAISQRKINEDLASRTEQGVARLQRVVSKLQTTSIDVQILSSVADISGVVENINQIFTSNSSVDYSSVLQEQLLNLETRLKTIESSLDSGMDSTDTSIDDEYERVKREIEFNANREESQRASMAAALPSATVARGNVSAAVPPEPLTSVPAGGPPVTGGDRDIQDLEERMKSLRQPFKKE